MVTIFISFLFLMVIIFIGLNFSNWIKNKTNNKIIYRLLAGYVIGLMAITVGYVTIAQPKLAENVQYKDVPYLFDLLYVDEDKIGELPEEYVKEKWELPTQLEQLTLQANGYIDEANMIDVVVEFGEIEKGEVILYETPTTISNIDVSEHIPLHDMKVEGDSLIVNYSDYIEAKFLAIKNEMTVIQFLQKHRDIDYFNVHNGEQVLLVKLPKNVDVNANEDYFYLHYK